jgi:hydrogenase maturation factor
VETVDTTVVAPVHVGDLVLVHAGTAIAVVREEPS